MLPEESSKGVRKMTSEEARQAQYAKLDAIECAIFERFDLEMTIEQAESCSHQGNCDEDVAELIEQPEIIAQIEKIGPDAIRGELEEWGAWNDDELENDQENVLRILWIAAGNITDEVDSRTNLRGDICHL